MPAEKVRAVLDRIQALQAQLEQELQTVVAEKQSRFHYSLQKGKVIFEKGVHDLHARYRLGLWQYLKAARPAHILTAPIIYSVIVPLVLVDVAITIYQQTCFRVYGIPLVRRREYIVIDRQHLAYLNAIEKLNCMYCGYGNGLAAYAREIIARTEQYWCPIKHARRVRGRHERAQKFVDYGDAEDYRDGLRALREELRREKS